MIISDSDKKQEQFTLDHQSRTAAERAFLQSREEFLNATNEIELKRAEQRIEIARSALFLEFGYSLEQVARLVDEYETGDAA